MNINFSEVFKKLRRERELTQEQAAEAFSVSTQAVSMRENGQTSPDISLLPIIAEYFGVSIETLLGVDSEKRKALHEQYMNEFETAIKSGRRSQRSKASACKGRLECSVPMRKGRE